MVVPGVNHTWINLGLDARHDAKVVAGALQTPEQVRVARIADSHGGSIGENDVQFDHIVANQAVLPLETTMASAEGGAQKADAFHGSRSWMKSSVSDTMLTLSMSVL